MDYKELDVWINAKELATAVYVLTRGFPRDEQFGLTAQIRRGVVSIPSNIAEGCGRRISADTVKLLTRARGSLNELETQLYIELDQGYIEERKFMMVSDRVVLCKKLINGFIRYFKKW